MIDGVDGSEFLFMLAQSKVKCFTVTKSGKPFSNVCLLPVQAVMMGAKGASRSAHCAHCAHTDHRFIIYSSGCSILSAKSHCIEKIQ